MNNLQIFKSTEFGQIRGFKDENNEPWFVGKDVAEALGYVNASKAVANHVDVEDKQFSMVNIADSQNGNVLGQSKTAIINESGLYSLILSSKLPTAKRFKHWVTSEVLPSIRKNGGYITNQENLSDSELLAKALLVAQRTIENRNAEIERMRPKEIFADAVSASSSSILIGDLAKLICQNGVDIGQKRLFQWLRENGYLIKRKGSDWNMPTQRAVKMGLFEIKESSRLDANGCNVTTKTTKATGKGQVYFINKFLAAVQN